MPTADVLAAIDQELAGPEPSELGLLARLGMPAPKGARVLNVRTFDVPDDAPSLNTGWVESPDSGGGMSDPAYLPDHLRKRAERLAPPTRRKGRAG